MSKLLNHKIFNISYNHFIEIVFLISMLVTLIIPENLGNISLWSDISASQYIRASIWILGLSLFPGTYFLRLTRISKDLTKIENIAVGINLSFMLVGVITLILYYLRGSISILPWILLVIHTIMLYLNRNVSNGHTKIQNKKPSNWIFVLYFVMFTNIVIAFFVQLSQGYLVRGDLWVSLKSAVHIISQNSLPFMGDYPIMFGYILSGLSVCTGIPVVNTYVMLFPFIALNALSFFVLLKIVFNLNDKISSIATVLYTFTGGIGWLVQTLIYNGKLSFWSISLLCHDMYWSPYFRTNIYFSYKLLALTFSFVSIITFKMGLEYKDKLKRIITLVLSSLFITFSYMVHMLEPIIFLPIIIILSLLYKKRAKIYIYLGVFTLISLLSVYSVDVLTHGWYSWLTIIQLEAKGFKLISISYYIVFGLFTMMALSIGYYFNRRSNSKFNFMKFINPKFKLVIVAILMLIYVSGLLFLTPTSYLGYMPFPWHNHVARYGFIGILAIIGIGFSKWGKRWFILAIFWCMISILIGSVWLEWGSRMNSYQFPMLALFASVGIAGIIDKAPEYIFFNYSSQKKKSAPVLRLYFKPIVRVFIIVIVILSSTSFFYGASFYISQRENAWMAGPSISDDQVRLMVWIYQNIPRNITVLVPDISNIYRGVWGISNYNYLNSNTLQKNLDSSAIIGFTQTLRSKNIKYMVCEGIENSPLLTYFYDFSKLVFQSGDVRVYELPPFLSLPSSFDAQILVVDKEKLGFLDNITTIGWIDDTFTSDWSSRNVNFSSDGEVSTFEWSLNIISESEPHVTKKLNTPVNTSVYPYLTVRYRNMAYFDGVGQIIDILNDKGRVNGRISLHYLPASMGDSYSTFVVKLPSNNIISEIDIWMRNYEDNIGTTNLQIDYILFSSNPSYIGLGNRMRFMSVTIPLLLSSNYTVSSSFQDDASIIISAYDRSILPYIEDATNIQTIVFVNATVGFPSWGTEWKDVERGIISGDINGKKVIILGLDSINSMDIENLSKAILRELLDN